MRRTAGRCVTSNTDPRLWVIPTYWAVGTGFADYQRTSLPAGRHIKLTLVTYPHINIPVFCDVDIRNSRHGMFSTFLVRTALHSMRYTSFKLVGRCGINISCQEPAGSEQQVLRFTGIRTFSERSIKVQSAS